MELGSLLAQAVLALTSIQTLAEALPRHWRQAMENFFAVPRYRGATLHQEVRYKYSGVLVCIPQAQTLTFNPHIGAHFEWRLRRAPPNPQ